MAIRWYRDKASVTVATQLLAAMETDLERLRNNPVIGSPVVGDALQIDGLRAWAVSGFPLSVYYLVRADRVDVVRILGQRQDIATIPGSDT